MKKEDMVRFVTGKLEELGHIPPLVFDTLKKLRDDLCQGSNQKLAEVIAKCAGSKLSIEKVKESIHEGFDPVMNAEEVLSKHGKILIDKIMAAPRDQTIHQFMQIFKD